MTTKGARRTVLHDQGEGWRVDLLDEAIRAHATDVVERHMAKLPAEHHDPRLTLLAACLRQPPDLVARLEEHARFALESEDIEATFSLAYTMLDFLPALGIFVARGALRKDRTSISGRVSSTPTATRS